jgi:hypothetical protein
MSGQASPPDANIRSKPANQAKTAEIAVPIGQSQTFLPYVKCSFTIPGEF